MDGRSNFHEISIGFSAEQVIKLAGDPESVTRTAEGECWHYQNGKISVYLGGEKWPWVRKLIIKQHRAGKDPEKMVSRGRK